MHGPGVDAWSRPPLNEVLAMAEIYEIGAAAGVHSHVVHCSVPRGIEICEAYKRMGYRASVEVRLPHLFLAEEDVERLVGFAKINPPIRTTADREGLWHHLTAGHIDLVSTDHVIYPLERKNHPEMLKNGSGLPGLELLLPLLLTGCRNRQVSMPVAARVLAFNPARHFRLAPFKGALEPGADADIVLVEPTDYAYDPSRGQTCVDWSPLCWAEIAYQGRGNMATRRHDL